MAKIRISGQNPANVQIPPPGEITIFADSTDNFIPKYKSSDGLIHSMGGSGGSGGEHQDSVISVLDDPSTITPNIGDSYLIADSAVGVWSGKDGQIATWGTVNWAYQSPNDGWTLKAKDQDTFLYHHEGDYVSGVFSWIKQPFTNDVLELPTDGSWDDGLFNFEGVLIIDAIDELNEFAAALAPPPAPILSDYSELNMSPQANGKLSFDTLNPIGGYAAADAVGIPIPVSIDQLFPPGGGTSGKRLGITDATAGTIGGILNNQVAADTGTPNPAYPANAWGDANKGTLRISLNGIEISALDLTILTAQDSSGGDTVTGLNISAAQDILFPQGAPLTAFKYRTGTWTVKKSDLVNGYNSIIVEHEVSPTEFRTLDRYDVVLDSDTTATTITVPVLDNLIMLGSKKISGIDYHTGGSAEYDVLIDNAYRNTYYQDTDAITYQGTNCSASQESLPAGLGDEAKQIAIVDKLVTITPVGTRILNSNIDIQVTVRRTVQSVVQGGLASIDNILLDNTIPAPTDTGEDFYGELYRMPSNTNFDAFGGFSTGMWDSEQSLDDGAAGFIDGLMVFDGKLVYPANAPITDFRTSNILNGSTFNDGGTKGSARDYSGLTGDRVYYRWFKQVSPTVGNFVLNISGSGGTFVDVGTGLTGNNIHVEMRAPSQTGWMDCYADFATGQFGDADGARNASAGTGRAFGTNWGLTIGTKNTASTGGYMVLKITVGDSFTGEIDGITFNFG